MATPTVPYTFTSSTTGLATQVNSNFAAIFSAAADGASSISVNAFTVGSTCSFSGSASIGGSASFKGNVTLGSASGNVLTFNADLLPRSSTCQSLGTTSLAWAASVFGSDTSESYSASGNTIAVSGGTVAPNAFYGVLAARAWATIGSQGTYLTGVNVSSASRVGTGAYRVFFRLPFATSQYVGYGSSYGISGPIGPDVPFHVTTQSAGGCGIALEPSSPIDLLFHVVFHGNQ